MTEPDRKSAAASFRRHIERSNELHAEYQDDPALFADYDRFTRWQLDYLLPLFSDLSAIEGYGEAIDFIMSDLAGVGISSRDRDLARAAPVIGATLPLQALTTLAAAAEANVRVLEINLGICRALLEDGRLPVTMTERRYFEACRETSSYEECLEVVQVVVGLGEALRSLIGVPLIGGTLRAMRRPAHAAGFGALQEFLETGYRTFHRIPDIDHFLEQIRERMARVFDRIFHLPIEQAGRSPVA